MNIRSKILHGTISASERLLLLKEPKGAKTDDLLSVTTQRRARRSANHRIEDRHRLINERARLSWDGVDHTVELINLSGGGAMIIAPLQPRLWDPVTLHLGTNGTVECAVCWRRDERIGLQFVEETRLDCPVEEVAALLRDVIANSFSESEFEVPSLPASKDEPAPAIDEGRDAHRHPLIWNAVLHHDYHSSDVRVRNISTTGAMIELPEPVRIGSEPLIEFSDRLSISATVEWAIGDQVGLRFHTPFDLAELANIRPAVTKGWAPPSYLGSAGSAEWDRRWRRLDLDELKAELEGFMKR